MVDKIKTTDDLTTESKKAGAPVGVAAAASATTTPRPRATSTTKPKRASKGYRKHLRLQKQAGITK